jgi:small subunit ribosomal protein S6
VTQWSVFSGQSETAYDRQFAEARDFGGSDRISDHCPPTTDHCRNVRRKETRMSRLYEVMFIVRPDAVDEDVDKLIAGFTTSVTNGGGVVKNVEKMGRRKLAYLVRKFNDGNYILMTVEAGGPVVLELERRLRVSEPVIKFITVRMDEEEKRLAKVKALRGTRRKVSAEAPAAAPAPAPPVAVPPAAEASTTEAVPASA